jgi:hypothetical protein
MVEMQHMTERNWKDFTNCETVRLCIQRIKRHKKINLA